MNVKDVPLDRAFRRARHAAIIEFEIALIVLLVAAIVYQLVVR